MQVFDIYDNDITGSLPPQLSAWKQLNNFDVSNNLLTSTLPEQYSTFSSLELLYVQGNLFIGQVPIEYSAFSGLDDQVYPQNTDGLCSPSSRVLFDGDNSNLC
eukprot:TRINITY_DN3984_c0_g1_i2.p6 TRINITY_DN3984_c0_g1~~TRINITY_DN3984_c0_g1_i2.p6  ORF type:complete len:103 (+),score=8.43 TRINITY_DN3984_c0_g1_i2:248-556(+)